MDPLGLTSLLSFMHLSRYKICEILEKNFVVQVPGQGCKTLRRINGSTIGNPPVFFDEQTPPTLPAISLDGYGTLIGENDWLANETIEHVLCDMLHPLAADTVAGVSEGKYYLFDPRSDFKRNTVLEPLMDGGGAMVEQTEGSVDEQRHVLCSNPHMSFLNEEVCQLSTDPAACSPRDHPDIPVELTTETFQKIFQSTKSSGYGARYVYAVQGLRQTGESLPYDSPCTPGTTSRWVTIAECSQNVNQVQASTSTVFANLITAQSLDPNSLLRDVTFPATGVSCDSLDMNRFDFAVLVDGQCWLNVHQDHLQVYDFTPFVDQHPGGPDKIKQFANTSRTDKFVLTFPSWHGMERFHGWSSDFREELGRYGDSIPFSDLPDSLQREDIAVAIGGVAALRSAGPTVVCGSPGEVENVEEFAGNLGSGAFVARGNHGGTGQILGLFQRRMVWLAIVLSANDVLRQRVAWALSQIIVVSPEMIFGGVQTYTMTEEFMVRLDCVSKSEQYLCLIAHVVGLH